jgi:surface protein
MFFSCTKLTSLDVSNWNTNKVTNMQSMFNNCNNLTSLDVSNFDTSNVESMYQMFQDCSNLTSLDVSGFNTNKVIHMGSMFYNCSNLTSLDLSSFDTSNVNYMHYMFTYCSKLTNLDLSVFDTSNVTRMEFIFYNCLGLTSLDVSSFNTSNVTDTTSMFANSNSLEVITMFNSDINTINTVGNLTSATIYVDESLDQSQYTGTAPLKVYKEEKLEIKLNSPLLKGDTIEVVDGKLCHVHRYEKVVFDGSEDETFITIVDTSLNYKGTVTFVGIELPDAFADNTKCTVTCDRFISIPGNTYDY